MDYELIGLLGMTLIGAMWSGYYGYLAWVRPEKFRAMAEKSLPFYGNSSVMKEWISSSFYAWFARLGMVFVFVLCTGVFFLSLWRMLMN